MTSTYVLKSEDYYRNFNESIKTKDTLESYNSRLKAFMKYKGISLGDFASLIEGKHTREIEADIRDFIKSLKDRHYAFASQKTYLAALCHFYSFNDVVLNRKKLSGFLSNDDCAVTTQEEGECEGQGDGDKPYTHEQIARLLEFSDLRTKAIILIMASAGLRLGALELLRMGDLTPIPAYQIYQIRVYANSKSKRHYTFCTPECRTTIDNYIEWRKQYGENITPKSPLFRGEFDKHDIFAVANKVKPITKDSIKKSIQEVLYASGIRTPLVKAATRLNYRRDIAMSHGFRKYFDTTCTHSGMNPIYIEFCLGHSLKGVKDSYFLPQPDSNGVYLDILTIYRPSLNSKVQDRELR
jgi:integrase